ncbi:MAG: IMPACT family protein [Halanaerobiaceae bacterium]
MKGEIIVPAGEKEIVYRVKDSKFYGNIFSADSRDRAQGFITQIRDRFSDATHNVNAYRIGQSDEVVEYADDDGEPSGSSGPPVLQAIKGEGLTNTVVVVSRYFGGTKLGIGGLIRAYGNTARKVIHSVEKKRLQLYYKVRAEGTYDKFGTVLGQVESFGGEIIDTDYSNEGPEVTFYLIPGEYDSLRGALVEKTGNKVEVEIESRVYF